MKNIRYIVLGFILLGSTVQSSFSAKSSPQKKYESACNAISEIVRKKDAAEKELKDLKNRLREVFPGAEGDALAQISEIAVLREKLKELIPQTEDGGAEAAGIIHQMEVVLEKLKSHNLMVDLMTSIIPDEIQLEEKTGDLEKDLQQRLQVLVGLYNSAIKNREKMKRQLSTKNNELKKARRDRDKAEHYLIELSNYAVDQSK
jgi:chromosome segregation ATPase